MLGHVRARGSASRCGDGAVDPATEECDDGNTTSCDGCSFLCRTEGCGNGSVECGEECDDGNTVDDDGCSATCTLELPDCGDGIRDPVREECDDGNVLAGDGCSPRCERELLGCGDGLVDPAQRRM